MRNYGEFILKEKTNKLGGKFILGLYTESDYENLIIELFQTDLGYKYVYGPDIERDFYSPLYEDVLIESLYRLNRGVPDDAIQEALYKLKNFKMVSLCRKMPYLWTICKMVFLSDILLMVKSVPLLSILLTITPLFETRPFCLF